MSDLLHQPLATRMRPATLDAFFGQAHLCGEGRPIYQAIKHHHLHSMILWGPPGTGKTTLANIIAKESGAAVESLSAVLSGVKDIRQVSERAVYRRQEDGQQTVLFVDEVHRFNKAQQDAFLPEIESGRLIFIGATTENPSFQLNNALLSRARVYVLKALTDADLFTIARRALTDKALGLGEKQLQISDEELSRLVSAADGDARQCLNFLEVLSDFAEASVITSDTIDQVLSQSLRRFDHHGDAFYDQISALHKSVRGSDPDAALYWFCRMVDGGCDIYYVARRVIRMATEEVGNADPRGLRLALDAWETYERLGSPEGELAIAQAIVYLSCAAKSNAVYKAYNSALQDAKSLGSMEVPIHLRNAPTKLMKSLGYGKAYRYAHDEPNAYAKGEHYFPENMTARKYYQPVDRGLEKKIKAKLEALKADE